MWRRLSCSAFLVVALAACGGDTDLAGPGGNTPSPAGPASLTVSPDSETLLLGEKLQLSITAKDLNDQPCDCAPTYSSSDPAIASVSTDGLVTAKAAGEVWISVLCVGGVSAKVKIVVKLAVATLELDPVSVTLKVGSDLQLKVVAKDIHGLPVDCDAIFESLDPVLAKVTETTGVVTALLPGVVEIQATCDGISAKTTLTQIL